MSPQEYLAIERKAEIKSEYGHGHMFAMVGATKEHAHIASNLIVALGSRLRNGGCSVYGSDLRLHIPATGLFVYPDLMVVCGEEKYLDGEFDTLLNPDVIIEILSPSTKDKDQSSKFEGYRSIPSLKEYLTIAQDRVMIEQWVRQEGGWWFNEHKDIAAALTIASLHPLSLDINAIYFKVDLNKSTLNPERIHL